MSSDLQTEIVRWAHRCRVYLVLATGVAFTACGGGGGGGGDSGGGAGLPVGEGADGGRTLSVSVSYDGSAFLYRSSRVVPTITGLDGRAPQCSLASGTLPAGMALHADCSISGIPTESGTFPIKVRVGAAGIPNELAWNASVLVFGPSLVYSIPWMVTAGATLDMQTLNNFWVPSVADVVSYSIEGALPDGLVLDTQTGHIHGAPTTPGSYSFKIAVRTVNSGRTTFEVQRQPNLLEVRLPTIRYDQSQAWVGLPFSSTPTLPGGITYAFSARTLPAGITVDAVSGVISGTATRPEEYSTMHTIDLVPSGAPQGAFSTNVSLQVSSPVYIWYAGPIVTVGAPYSSSPSFINNSHGQLDGISYTYALAPDSALPPGLSLDPVTGTIAGPTDRYVGSLITVNVTVTLNGVTFLYPVQASIAIQ
jgi:hypothetical protein